MKYLIIILSLIFFSCSSDDDVNCDNFDKKETAYNDYFLSFKGFFNSKYNKTKADLLIKGYETRLKDSCEEFCKTTQELNQDYAAYYEIIQGEQEKESMVSEIRSINSEYVVCD